MKLKDVLSKYDFPPEVLTIYEQDKIDHLYPPQAEAITQGALKGDNLLLSVPTAAGKTLIAELAMLRNIINGKGRALYIVPLKALANEKFEDFRKKFDPLKIKVSMATGDLDTAEQFLSRAQIIIATAEKVDALLRARTRWLINGLGTVVLDEIHFINDGSRGPTLEILAARIKQLNPQAQILALSATVANSDEMARWLNAKAVVSQWRPIPLKEGVYYNKRIVFHNDGTRIITEDADEDICQLTLDTLRQDGQVLIFVNSRRSAQAASRQVAAEVKGLLKPEDRKKLSELSLSIVGAASSATKICKQLGEAVRGGTAFHHAGLKPRQRKLVEDNFKNGLIKVICSTPTLAAGVNLPARRAVIRDVKRFEDGLGSAYIPTSEYKQCAGRAGRPKYDPHGEAVIIAKTEAESKILVDKYIKAGPEPVISKLGEESALRFHILASVAAGYVHDINDTFTFFSHTFLASQKQCPNLLSDIGNVLGFLTTENFLEKTGFHYIATPFGQCTSRLYIDPMSAIILRRGLQKVGQGKSFSPIGLLHLCCLCPNNPLLRPGTTFQEEAETFASSFGDEFIFDQNNFPELEDYFFYLSVLKTTMMLLRWIEESKEDEICDEFGIGPGDIYRHMESTRWLLHAALVFADLLELKKLTFVLAHLKARVQYGIKEELIELVTIKGIGRIRARLLFEKGFKTPKDLKFASVDDIAGIGSIGKALAKDILEQVSGKALRRQLDHMTEETGNIL